MHLGTCYKKSNNLKKSKKSFEKVIEILPYTSDVYNKKAREFELIEENSYCIICLQKSIFIDSLQYGVYVKLGNILKKDKQIKNALFTLKKAMNLDTANYIAFENYGRIKYEIGEYNESIKYSKIACDKNPSAFNSKANIAICELALGNNEKAKDLFKELKNNLDDLNIGSIINDLNSLIENNISKQASIEVKEILMSNI